MIGYGGQGFLNVDIVVKTNMNLIDIHVKKQDKCVIVDAIQI